ncbi:MAG TPA: cytochrome P450, partial [Pseudonocardia sp.]|nr:cytochrome P450 [Pseudonocardia sp.]
DPEPVYAQLREAGPVVWLERYGYYAFPRFAEVSRALKDWDTFTSGAGVGFNDPFNSVRSSSLLSHGEQHDEIRWIETRPLTPERLAEYQPIIKEYARNLVDGLAERRTVDGVLDIAARLPLDVVTDLVGLDNAGRENLLNWGVEAFNMVGPMHSPLTENAFAAWQGFMQYAEKNVPDNAKPGGWVEELYRNAREAGWDDGFTRGVMIDYVGPSLDTTIHATSTGLLLFAQHPEQWDKVRANPGLLAKTAIVEIVRMATPIQYFTRHVTRDVEVEGVTIPKGSRVVIMYASANKDERKFPDPHTFDVERRAAEQVAWGGGKHTCIGKALARMEMIALFELLAERVERFEAGSYSYNVNNIVRGLEHLDLTLVPATTAPGPSSATPAGEPRCPR